MHIAHTPRVPVRKQLNVTTTRLEHLWLNSTSH